MLGLVLQLAQLPAGRLFVVLAGHEALVGASAEPVLEPCLGAAHQTTARAVALPKRLVAIHMLAGRLGLGPKAYLVVTDCSSKDSLRPLLPHRKMFNFSATK